MWLRTFAEVGTLLNFHLVFQRTLSRTRISPKFLSHLSVHKLRTDYGNSKGSPLRGCYCRQSSRMTEHKQAQMDPSQCLRRQGWLTGRHRLNSVDSNPKSLFKKATTSTILSEHSPEEQWPSVHLALSAYWLTVNIWKLLTFVRDDHDKANTPCWKILSSSFHSC